MFDIEYIYDNGQIDVWEGVAAAHDRDALRKAASEEGRSLADADVRVCHGGRMAIWAGVTVYVFPA
jgi:hypothetical protein